MVAVYKSLVSEFDRWFASVPASTQPNRLYVHFGTSHGATSNNAALLAKGYPQRTIFDDLDAAGKSFRIYFQNIPATLFYRSLRKLKYVGKFHPYGQSFKSDAKKGNLPSYAVVEQRYMDSKAEPANDDHPSHDVYEGIDVCDRGVRDATGQPAVERNPSGVPSPDDVVGPDPFYFKFDRLGVRVPTIVVSPWVKGTEMAPVLYRAIKDKDMSTKSGWVVHGPNGLPTSTSEYEHSSILATVRKVFNLSSPPLTKREAWAGKFDGILQILSQPRTDCPEQLPTPVKIRKGEANEDAKVSEFQQELIQLAAVLKGEDILTSYPSKIGQNMTVRQGKEYMESAVKGFFEAGFAAKKMGVDEEQIVKMRPSLTTRP
ncbi:hypothetical protein CASFOL_030329 [Castilleja foliolosa]|uniref:Uncharacterized protein n=1 Tax=Castilleja foliolosa TaxID=1961234 RepID=A0ABD3C7L1_9LAMI